MVWDVRGYSGPAENGEGGNIQGEAKAVDTMPVLWGGYHSGVYSSAYEENARERPIN